MHRIRGGEQLTPTSFANNWIQADNGDGNRVIVPPGTVRLDPDELEWFRDHPHTGRFWDWYEITEDLRFRKRKPERN